MSRADLRKKALITEVNALGTAFLRADLLDEPGRTDVRQRLYDYTKSRNVQPGTITTLEEVQSVVKRSKELPGSRLCFQKKIASLDTEILSSKPVIKMPL